jgi:hypothetical protein
MNIEITVNTLNDIPDSAVLYALFDMQPQGNTVIGYLDDTCIYYRQLDGQVWYGQQASLKLSAAQHAEMLANDFEGECLIIEGYKQ